VWVYVFTYACVCWVLHVFAGFGYVLNMNHMCACLVVCVYVFTLVCVCVCVPDIACFRVVRGLRVCVLIWVILKWVRLCSCVCMFSHKCVYVWIRYRLALGMHLMWIKWVCVANGCVYMCPISYVFTQVWVCACSIYQFFVWAEGFGCVNWYASYMIVCLFVCGCVCVCGWSASQFCWLWRIQQCVSVLELWGGYG